MSSNMDIASIKVTVEYLRNCRPPEDFSGMRTLNLDYFELGEISFEEAKEIVELEAEALAIIRGSADRLEAEDEIAIGEYGSQMLGLDVGVAGLVAALSAHGCATVTSCNGGALSGIGHHESHPLVITYVAPHVASRLFGIAEDLGVGLSSSTGASLMISSQCVDNLHKLAEALLQV